MTPFATSGQATIYHGDCRRVMAAMPRESVDAVVTDPPYGIEFMSREWDRGVPGRVFWRHARRVAKPGAHLVAFGGPRTFHRLTCAIEDAGWEIRDVVAWLYGSGFPKNLNVGEGLGTALKPAWEPCVLARKPLDRSVARTIEKHGTGALNIEQCRIPCEPRMKIESDRHLKTNVSEGGTRGGSRAAGSTDLGRWPANVALDKVAAAELDARVADSDGPSRFFYTAKASRAEREEGLEHMAAARRTDGRKAIDGPGADNPRLRSSARRNDHPTVKPLDLMRWLVRLVTPMGGVVLDPFMGSGTTLRAAQDELFASIGIDNEVRPCQIAAGRIRSPLLFEKSAAGGEG